MEQKEETFFMVLDDNNCGCWTGTSYSYAEAVAKRLAKKRLRKKCTVLQTWKGFTEGGREIDYTPKETGQSDLKDTFFMIMWRDDWPEWHLVAALIAYTELDAENKARDLAKENPKRQYLVVRANNIRVDDPLEKGVRQMEETFYVVICEEDEGIWCGYSIYKAEQNALYKASEDADRNPGKEFFVMKATHKVKSNGVQTTQLE